MSCRCSASRAAPATAVRRRSHERSRLRTRVPPARYRASFVPVPTAGKPEDAMESTMTYQATIREAATIRGRGPSSSRRLSEDRTHVRASGCAGRRTESVRPFNPLVRDLLRRCVGVPRESLRADACMTVPAGWTPGGQLELREIRGGRYAVTLHVGPYAELERAYKWLYGTWLAAERRGARECAVRRGVPERRAHRAAD